MPPDTATSGRVTLVGAGPGPPDLMTVRAQQAVAQAQALLYDALVEPEVLALAPAACLKLQTGKRAGGPSMAQPTINALMLKLAKRGLRVVRLKGGDPSIFGRSGEETAYLQARGVEVEVVPGVTAASAAAAQFGFPLTHRGEARRLVFATARIEGGELIAEGWPANADPQVTLALYMARDALSAVSAALIGAGRDPRTPVLAVANAGRASAHAISGELHSLAAQLAGKCCNDPVIVIIGSVTGLGRIGQTSFAMSRANPTNRAHRT